MAIITLQDPTDQQMAWGDDAQLLADPHYASWVKVADGEPQNGRADLARIENGVWNNFPVAQQLIMDATAQIVADHFARGWTNTFSVGTYTLDLRTGTDDKQNWTLRLFKVTGQVQNGQGATMVRFVAQDNSEFYIPASEAYTALNAFLAWGEAVLDRKWDIRKAVLAATDQAALDAIDVTAGWPS